MKSRPRFFAVSIKSGELKGYEKDWKINGEAVKLAVEKQ